MSQPKHDSLASALAAAQGEMNDARLGGSGNFGHYADLPSLRAACVPVEPRDRGSSDRHG